jgi:hypothetical protein
MRDCKLKRATLVIAKLDRHEIDAGLLEAQQETGVAGETIVAKGPDRRLTCRKHG